MGDYLDLDKPADNIRAHVKTRGSLDAEPVHYLMKGRVYAQRSGMAPLPMFETFGLETSQYRQESMLRFLYTAQYFPIYTQFGERLRAKTLVNPVTRKTITPPLRPSPPTVSVLLTNEGYAPASADFASALPVDRNAVRPWSVADGVLEIADQVIELDTPQLNIFTTRASWTDVQNPDIRNVAATRFLTTVGPFRPWLEMLDTEGSLLWHVSMEKLSSREQLPNFLRDEILRHAPGMMR